MTFIYGDEKMRMLTNADCMLFFSSGKVDGPRFDADRNVYIFDEHVNTVTKVSLNVEVHETMRKSHVLKTATDIARYLLKTSCKHGKESKDKNVHKPCFLCGTALVPAGALSPLPYSSPDTIMAIMTARGIA